MKCAAETEAWAGIVSTSTGLLDLVRTGSSTRRELCGRGELQMHVQSGVTLSCSSCSRAVWDGRLPHKVWHVGAVHAGNDMKRHRQCKNRNAALYLEHLSRSRPRA